MRIERECLRLYAVTDGRWLPGKKKASEELAAVTEELIRAGVTCVQLREKGKSDAELLEEALALKEVCRRFGVPLIINDRADIAKKAGADGVHVGLEDMEIERAREFLGGGYIIGASAHNAEEAVRAQEAGADYIGCGAVFGSVTKTNVTRLPLEELAEICASVRIPAVAIGGIDAENIGLLKKTGVCGAAVISALFAAEDKKRAVKELLLRWEAGY